MGTAHPTRLKNTGIMILEPQREVLVPNIVKLRRGVREGSSMKVKKNTKNKKMYPYSYIYKKERRILVWMSDGDNKDIFMTDSFGNLICTKTRKSLQKILGKDFEKVYWKDSGMMDFDMFWEVLRKLRVDKPISAKTCNIMNDGWNFIEDLLQTFDLDKEQRKLRTPLLQKVYNKFFNGINLPAITPDGMHYSPCCTHTEIRVLRKRLHEVWGTLQKTNSFC